MNINLFGIEIAISIHVSDKRYIKRVIREAEKVIAPHLRGSAIERIKVIRNLGKFFPHDMRYIGYNNQWQIGLVDAKDFVETYWIEGTEREELIKSRRAE